MFERLMNLDVELMCLGTKAFVAKEELINDVFYSKPRKGAISESEKIDDLKEEIIELMEKVRQTKEDGVDSTEFEEALKNKMDAFLTVPKALEEPSVTKEQISELLDKIEVYKAEEKDISVLEEQLKEMMSAFLRISETKESNSLFSRMQEEMDKEIAKNDSFLSKMKVQMTTE